jgi:hypothetical protein
VIQFDFSEQFQASLLVLMASEPKKHDELLQSLVAATGQSVAWFSAKHCIRPLDQPHFFEPVMFASFDVAAYFTIFAHFETECGLPNGRITLVTFWKPAYLMPCH